MKEIQLVRRLGEVRDFENVLVDKIIEMHHKEFPADLCCSKNLERTLAKKESEVIVGKLLKIGKIYNAHKLEKDFLIHAVVSDGKGVHYFNFHQDREHIIMRVYMNGADYGVIKEAEQKIDKNFSDLIVKDKNEIQIEIDWYFNPADMEYKNVVEKIDEKFYPEAYPYIENLDEYINAYLDSREKVLILYGPSGTGKTKLIRYILKKMHQKNQEHDERIEVMFTTDPAVFENEKFFIQFLQNAYHALVLEDIDFHLSSRKENSNPLMYKLLTVSDGLISNLNKKIILSTNLPNTQNIDEALLRAGRCFDMIKMRSLTVEETHHFFKAYSAESGFEPEAVFADFKQKNPNQREYVLARIYEYLNHPLNQGIIRQKHIQPLQGMGFHPK